MDIQSVNNNFYNNTLLANQQKTANAVTAEADSAAAEELEGVEFVKSEEPSNVTYDRTATVEYLKQAQEARMASFKNMIAKLLNQQGEKYKISMPDFEFTMSEADVEAAKAAIAEGGEWSVEAVSDRIMEMAHALAGDDNSKIDLLKNAVLAGFKSAKGLWGGEMPEITGKTYDRVMEAFDKWESEANGEVADTEENTESTDTTDKTDTEPTGTTDSAE